MIKKNINIALLDFKIYYKAKAFQHCTGTPHKQNNQQNRLESLEINLYIYSQSSFNVDNKTYVKLRAAPSVYGARKNWMCTCRRTRLEYYPLSVIKSS